MSKQRFSQGIIHIGLGKTGTSSIQSNLLKNFETLENMGFHFPIIDKDPRPFNGNHSIIMTSIFSDNAIYLASNINTGFNTREKLNTSNKKVLTKIYDGFSKTKSDKLIISAEAATHFDNKTVSKMSLWLKEYCDNIKIVACLRHPEDALASEIQQQIKVGKTLDELYDNPPISPISGCLQRHIDYYGSENVFVYDFLPATNHEHGLFGAFLEQINLHHEDFSISYDYENQSLSQESVLLLSALNKLRPLKTGSKLGHKRFLRDRELFSTLPGAKYKIPEYVLNKSIEAIEEEEAWVNQKFGLQLSKKSSRKFQTENQFSQQAIEKLVTAISDLQNKIEYNRLVNLIKTQDINNPQEVEKLKSEADRLT